jgi:hypothetical protein
MSDVGWLIVAIVAAIVFGVLWLKREIWIHRRRAGRDDRSGD